MILPTPAESFAWREFDGRPGLACLPLEELAPHLFTTSAWPAGARTFDVEPGEPWDAVASAIGVEEAKLVHPRQVHGTAVLVGPAAPGCPPPDADIVVLCERGLAAAIQVADCVPILVADRRSGAVAAVHAGWRGLAARAPQVAVQALARECAARPSDLVVALGPSIGACCYEVGPDVRVRFAASGFEDAALRRWFEDRPAEIARNPPMAAVLKRTPRPDHWFFDGWSATREQLIEAGVPAAQIFGAGLCTASHPDVLSSYRRDGSPSGRIVGAIRCGMRRP